MDDDELIARLAGGDDVALRELFGRHARWLAGRLRTALPASDVEDVLQETFLEVWRSAPNYRAQDSAAGWLWTIARRRAAMWLRKNGRTDEVALFAEPVAEDPSEGVIVREDLRAALDAIGPEGGPDREVFRLVYEQDRPVAEVAVLLGVPEGTVKSRSFRVRRALRAALGEHRTAEERI